MIKRYVSLFGGAALLAGCSVYGNLTELQNTSAVGTDFTKALAGEYQEFSEFEMYEMRDYVDADYFARKGLRVAAGEVVAPEDPTTWDQPSDKIDELIAARSRLVNALDNGGRDRFPSEAALAQGKYDCWVEQQEENHQPDDIAECKAEFEAAMQVLEGNLGSGPAAMQPANFIVFFDFDSSDVNDGARQVLDLVNSKFNDFQNGSIMLTGHTDTSGSVSYNESLSMDRGNNVRFMLIEMGVPASAISVDAKGESSPLEATADGVRNPQNRRVEISIQ